MEPTVTLLRRAKIEGAGWRRGPVAFTPKGKLKPNIIVIGGQEIDAPDGHYAVRVFEERTPKYINVGNVPGKAQLEYEKHARTIKARNTLTQDGIHVVIPIEKGGRSLRDLTKDFIEMKQLENHRSDFAVSAYDLAIDQFIAHSHRHFAHEITTADLLGFANWLTGPQEFTEKTRANRMARLFAFLRFAGLNLDTLLTKKQRSTLLGSMKKIPTKYEDEEIRELLQNAGRPYNRILLLLATYTGFRDQELMFLEWTDCDFKRNVVRVTGKPEAGFAPKDYEEREVPMAQDLKDALLSWRKVNPTTRYVIGSMGDQPNTKLLKALKTMARRSGLNCGQCKGCKSAHNECRKYTLHKFRRTYITRMLRALHGDLATVMKLAGHNDVATTMKYLSASEGDTLQSAANNAFGTLQVKTKKGKGTK